MKLACYHKGTGVRIEDAEAPVPGPEDVLVRTAACGLCSGELMGWYMDQKAPHVLGHEVCGWVDRSEDSRFPVGSLIFPHHHASCGTCHECRRGAEVHCEAWRATKLDPGGMAESFRVPKANLAETWVVNDLQPEDAALIEPVACVVKSVRRSGVREGQHVAVIGLGSMGLMHALVLRRRGISAAGIEVNPRRRAWAEKLGVRTPAQPEGGYEVIFVCPSSAEAVQLAANMAAPDAVILLFAPFGPGSSPRVDFDALYFREFRLVPSYSAGPGDCVEAIEELRKGAVSAADVVSDFIQLSELPDAYDAMKRGDILKPMVVFDGRTAV